MIAGRLAVTPEPPYTAVIFTSQRRPGDEGYGEMSVRMAELAAQQTGFLGVESARGEDGFGITVSYWKDEASARAWKGVMEHREAQALGKTRWYEAYSARIATVGRDYRMERD